MTDVEPSYEDFIASRRSGRRNAIHEIPAAAGSEGGPDLSESLTQLSINQPGDKDAEKSRDSPDKGEQSGGEGN